MKTEGEKKSKRTPGPFSFCTKHPGSFYASCKCPVPGTKKVKEERLVEVEEENPNTTMDV